MDYDGIWSSSNPTLSFLINESKLAECLRCCSSCCGLSISPLTQQYVPPRLLLLIPTERRPFGSWARGRSQRNKRPDGYSALDCPLGKSKPTKRRPKGSIPCYSMLDHSAKRMLWTRCFVHSNNRGRLFMGTCGPVMLLPPPVKEASAEESFPRV